MASILIIIASVVIFPFLTYYATSTLFFRRVNSKSSSKKPSTIPYFIPGVFHTISFAQLGARKFFAELIKDYGAFAPFKIRAGAHSYVVLRDPVQISRVLAAPGHLTDTAVRAETFDKLFGSPKAAELLRRSDASDQEERTFTQVPLHISEDTLASATEAYISILSANMHDKMFQFDSWTRIEDFWSFLQLVLLRCTLDTLFGSALLKQYPRMVRDYLDFNAAVEGFMYGMPRVMISGATKPRDRLHQGLRAWFTTTRDEFDDAISAGDGPAWDEKTGLQLIYKYQKDQRVDTKVRAAAVLSLVYMTNTGLVPSTFWMTVETLRKSHLARTMTANAAHHFSPITHKYDVAGLTQIPLIKSFQTEIHRLRTATCLVRTNKTDGYPLDKHWSLSKGATVAIFSHDVSSNTDVWKKLQPRALERPLEEFWAERFMAPERKDKFKKDTGTETRGSAIENLGDLITQLATSDQHWGPALISALQMASMAVLFAEFEIQLCDTELVDAALPPTGEFAYGTVKPLEKVAVRIRKRKT